MIKDEKNISNSNESESLNSFDYSFVHSSAIIALYDDMKSTPHIIHINPAPTVDFIEHLSSTVDEYAKKMGGKIPYTAIREVSENFIHAFFNNIVISILDDGNTIRFTDQGPGITEKEKAKKPGFTSATEPMKKYIRGVGSGLPIVCEWITDRNGTIIIEDNLTCGAVITISLVKKNIPDQSSLLFNQKSPYQARKTGADQPIMLPRIPLSEREQLFLSFLFSEGELGITEMKELSGFAVSTVHSTFMKLEQYSLIEKMPNKKRSLTSLGLQVVQSF